MEKQLVKTRIAKFEEQLCKVILPKPCYTHVKFVVKGTCKTTTTLGKLTKLDRPIHYLESLDNCHTYCELSNVVVAEKSTSDWKMPVYTIYTHEKDYVEGIMEDNLYNHSMEITPLTVSEFEEEIKKVIHDYEIEIIKTINKK